MIEVPKQHQICVLGAGSFGTALANMLAENNQQVSLWVRNPQKAEEMSNTGENSQWVVTDEEGNILALPARRGT